MRDRLSSAGQAGIKSVLPGDQCKAQEEINGDYHQLPIAQWSDIF
jgi:hypothetical protein